MMYLPNYKDGSIVNLMSSIEKALSGKPKYKPLKSLKPEELSDSKNIVLLVIDGLGYEYLMKHGKRTIFNKNLKDRITSIFPPTTATSIPAFLFGVPAQQHAITGWYTLLKEIGVVAAVLHLVSKLKGQPFDKAGINPKDIFQQKPFFEKIKVKSYHVSDEIILNTGFNLAINQKVKKLPFKRGSLNGFFRQIKKAINLNNRKKFIYAYWSEFDHFCHHYGTRSKKTLNHFKEIDKKLRSLLKSIKGTNTTVIVTSDHGFIECPKSKAIDVKKHPIIKDALTLPLCGEPRLAFCYVHPSKAKQFETYVKKKLKHACYLYKSEELIKKNYYGLFKPNKKLFDRVGDYTLIMKDGYQIKGGILDKKADFHLGNHGGVSKEEMFVPLITIKK